MNLFSWLLIGHLVGDWVLQNEYMANGKRLYAFGLACLLHCLLYTITLLISLWLAGSVQNDPASYLIAAAILFGSHWLIDGWNLAEKWGRWFGQTPITFVRVMTDQTMHVCVLVLVVQVMTR